MISALTDILRLPLFPVVILGLIAWLYWRGAMTYRNKKAEGRPPSDEAKNP